MAGASLEPASPWSSPSAAASAAAARLTLGGGNRRSFLLDRHFGRDAFDDRLRTGAVNDFGLGSGRHGNGRSGMLRASRGLRHLRLIVDLLRIHIVDIALG